jgi:molybdopterin molybdotransferase
MTANAEQPGIRSFEDARLAVVQQAASVRASGTENVELLAAAGRVLAEPVLADRDIPPFPRATRDGFAVRAADLAELPATLRVVGEVRAGEKPSAIPSTLEAGEAVSIMTGAPVPEGADAVVMVEYTALRGQLVEIAKGVAVGENFVPRGAEAKRGSLLLDRGGRLNDAGIALAASAGRACLRVYAKPRVAVLTTGDEIVGLDADPGPTQIRNSNSYSLAVQILAAGGTPVLIPIAPDEPQRLRQLIEQGLQSDLLLLTGGVSMGRYDLVEQVLAELQAEFFFTGAKIQPGRPVVFGRVPYLPGRQSGGAEASTREGVSAAAEGKYFFGLPGNPVSTMVTFELFARPMVEALAGMSPRKLVFVYARLKSEIRVKTGLKRFLPAILSGEFENSLVELVAWQGSGDIAATARANCYVVVPPDRERIAAGEFVAVMMR